MNIDESQILKYWEEWDLPKYIKVKMDRDLTTNDLSLLKDATNRSIWIIHVPTSDKNFSVILKLCVGSKHRQREAILYEGLKDTPTSQFMPDMYLIREGETGHGFLMFMENLKVLSGKDEVLPEDLYKVAPVLARLHATTFTGKPMSRKIRPMVPEFLSSMRTKKLSSCKTDLEEAKKIPSLWKVIEENCPELPQLLELNLDFPEVINSGFCLTHSDLTLNNIGYDDSHGDNWTIKFIDYGAATYAPCWLDLVKLIESPIDHQPEWDADEVRKTIIRLYVEEMEQQGITFNYDPQHLYRLAFLMRVIENEFRRNLSLAIKRKGKMRRVFPTILSKISKFNHELGLLESNQK